MHEMEIAALLTLHNSFMDFVSQMIASKIFMTIHLPQHAQFEDKQFEN